MSYLYDKLRDALGGKNFRTGIVIKDWSPNEVRAVYIMRNFILIADYLKQPKIVMLDENEVGIDLMNTSRRGNLNNLLDNRHLSCLEEIYVDTAFSQYRDVIDLNAYVQSLYNQSSRLRYFGYVRGFDVNMLGNAYSQALMNGTLDFTVAKNIGGFEYQDTGNKDWYKKYNLRPQWYSIDGEKGRLHTYFSKCEKLVGSELEAKDKQINLLANAEKVIDMFYTDLRRVYDLKLLSKFIEFCKGCDDFTKLIAENVHEGLRRKIPIQGLSKDLFQQSMRLGKVPFGNDEKFLVDIYNSVGVFDDSGKPFEPNDDVVRDGIFQLSERLDYGLASALGKNTKKENYILFMLSSMRSHKGGLPEGRLTDLLKKKNLLVLEPSAFKGESDGLLEYMYNVCGFKQEDFASNITAKR